MSKEMDEEFKKAIEMCPTVKTAKDLKDFLNKLPDSELNVPIYFDTEARTFNYHMARVGMACLENSDNMPEKFLGFFEKYFPEDTCEECGK